MQNEERADRAGEIGDYFTAMTTRPKNVYTMRGPKGPIGTMIGLHFFSTEV